MAATIVSEDEQFVRFHFGEMSPEELRAFERRLEADADLSARYDAFRDCLGRDDGFVPADLAERTATRLRVSGRSLAGSPAVGRAGARVADWAFGSVAVLVVALAAVPATLASRESARRNTCAHSLHEIGLALAAYSRDHGGHFPQTSPYGYAGLFAVSLADGEYAKREWLETALVCPSSGLAEEIARGRSRVVVPTFAEYYAAPTVLAGPLRRLLGGSYAYRLGYLTQSGRYAGVRNRGDCRSALMSDAPSPGSVAGHNHGSCSQNVLFQDGSVRFRTGCWAPDGEDHLFLNAAGKIAAGRNPRDAVLAASWAGADLVRPRDRGETSR